MSKQISKLSRPCDTRSVCYATRTLTFCPSRSSLHREHRMGIMGLALAWEARIPALAQRERRVEEAFREKNPAPGAAADRREDTALAAACLSGDLRAYERLYSLHGARMKNLARNILGSATDAEDAVQETFLKVQRSIASFRGQSSLVTWTFRILVNTCYDARRSRLRKKEIAAEDDPQREDAAPRPEP